MASETITLVDGERVYPCRCGEVHQGPYAHYDYGHHACFHDAPLIIVDERLGPFCPSCGKAFTIAASAEEPPP